ncbi:MAG: nuclear transport factor 2 family protein [Bacteroidetes bacterium]|nr:nuclear transport factor 2 family protein [Bacteroidota bacterium]
MKKHSYLTILLSVLILFIVYSCCRKADGRYNSDELKATDRHYSEMSAEKGMNAAFLAMFDSSGVKFNNNEMPIEGYKQISASLLKSPDTSFVLTWEPIKAFMSKSGDMGYTYGTYLVRNKRDGKKNGDGTYLTIWKRVGNDWKAVADVGTEGLMKADSTVK